MRPPRMHSIAEAFSKEKTKVCPTCRGAKRVYVGGSHIECYHCGGKGFLRQME